MSPSSVTEALHGDTMNPNRIEGAIAHLPAASVSSSTEETYLPSTEPYSPGYVEARLVDDENIPSFWSKLHLEPVHYEHSECRVLIYPRTENVSVASHGIKTRDGGQWVEVDMANNPHPARLFVVEPDRRQLGFVVSHQDTSCRFTFDPTRDSIILQNFSQNLLYPVLLDDDDDVYKLERGAFSLEPRHSTPLRVGVWALIINDQPLIEFQILKRINWRVNQPSSLKCAIMEGRDPRKRLKLPHTTQGISTRKHMVSTLPSSDNALVELKKGETIFVGRGNTGYWLKHHGTIFDQQNTSVWRGRHSRERGGQDIVVKVIKSRADALGVLKSNETWKREVTALAVVQGHPSIVRLIGGDARFLSIETEHVDGKALTKYMGPDFIFNGTTADAEKVMQNIASALSFVHAKEQVHNDIKPANILLGLTRGPVLIDFGLSSAKHDPLLHRGTPWYLPPEYLRSHTMRGPSSDVWTFGIVMLWMLHIIPLPEKSFGSWQISHIHSRMCSTADRETARGMMNAWLSYIDNMRSALRDDNELEQLVNRSLQTNMDRRIDAASLCQRLEGLRLTAPQDSATPCAI